MDEVGPWAETKLSCLEAYLTEYTKILSKQDWCRGYWYIDAFAGASRYRVRTKNNANNVDGQISFPGLTVSEEEKQFLTGSPQRAIGIPKPFTHYIFIDRDKKRVENLMALRDQNASLKISVRHGDCNKFLCDSVIPFLEGRPKFRVVVFLDPYGMHVPWETLNRIASTKHIEVFINFPFQMAIQRLFVNNPRKISWQRKKLNNYFGSKDWYDLVYRKEPDLFGGVENKIPGSYTAVIRWYQTRLKGIFRYASAPKLIRGTSGHPLYYLIWAGPNKTGHKIADYILSQGETLR